jgi:hypothetical protein
LRICSGKGALLLARFKGIPSSRARKRLLLLRIRKTPRWLFDSLALLLEACGNRGRGRGRIGAVFVELVVIAPIVPIICIPLGLHPLFSLHAVNICLK